MRIAFPSDCLLIPLAIKHFSCKLLKGNGKCAGKTYRPTILYIFEVILFKFSRINPTLRYLHAQISASEGNAACKRCLNEVS